jgi:pimeloyl-ACP methyl ester carboxylesterase
MKDRLILFVHGLGGAGEATWRSAAGVGFRELISRDAALADDADIAFFEYPTSLFRPPFSATPCRVRDLAEGLRSQLEVRYPDYKSVMLVCHSLGGLVARKYLVEEVKRADSRLRVDKLLLYAVPNNGAALAGIAKHISWRHNQLIQLCRNSELIEELNTDWAKLDMIKRIAIRYVVAGQDGVVDKQSAIHQWGNENVDSILDAGHISVVKPSGLRDLSYLIFRRFALGPIPVFLSVGGTRNSSQDAFVTSMKAFLASSGVAASTVDEYASTNRQPLKDVERRMNRCYGAIVLAFERSYIERGVSRRGSSAEALLQDVRLPPVWNQIEAAMAYTRGLPLLVLVEQDLQEDGMLESRYDWRVKRFDMSKSVVADPEFLGIFADWRESILARRDAPLATSAAGSVVSK